MKPPGYKSVQKCTALTLSLILSALDTILALNDCQVWICNAHCMCHVHVHVVRVGFNQALEILYISGGFEFKIKKKCSTVLLLQPIRCPHCVKSESVIIFYFGYNYLPFCFSFPNLITAIIMVLYML